MSERPGGRVRRITVVTPCFNAERYLGETLRSVLDQTAVTSGRVELEYLVCDGGSRDGSALLARRAGHPGVLVLSEPDRGMYDALSKGLRRATGEVVAYINAGDYYHRTAFDVVLDVMESRDVPWLTGLAVRYNEAAQVIDVSLPARYRRELIRRGVYDGRRLPLVQQESTFWRASLHRTVDFDRLATCRVAGDAYLWSRFATEAELTIVQAYLGGFRQHAGQLSENLDGYVRELHAVCEPAAAQHVVQAAVDRLAWRLPWGLKKRLNRRGLLRYDPKAGGWT